MNRALEVLLRAADGLDAPDIVAVGEARDARVVADDALALSDQLLAHVVLARAAEEDHIDVGEGCVIARIDARHRLVGAGGLGADQRRP